MEYAEASASANQEHSPSTGEPGHWCHQCIAAIVVQREGDADLICPNCGGGFIEALDTANTLASVRRAVRRQRRRQQWPSRSSRTVERLVDDGATEEEGEDASPQQVLRFLRLLSRNFRNSPSMSGRSAEVILNDRTHESYESDGYNSVHDQRGVGRSDSSLESMRRRMAVSLAQGGDDPVDGQFLDQVDDVIANEVIAENIEGSVLVNGDEDEEDMEDEEGEEIDSEVEAGLLELNDWESFDEEDEDGWEEVDFNEADLVARFLEAVDDGADGDGDAAGDDREQNTGAHAAQGDVLESNPQAENHRRQSQNVLPRSLHRRLQAIRRSLENYNTEFQVEGADLNAYIGNPGDYVDARGFEELLQQLVETDSIRRGAPPAAKAAIERLCSVKIKQENLENGSALCAICKDVVALNEPAKQLPCLHLYHSVCILPWLSARNSCPLCRYELPTDDPDYEEQRKGESTTPSVGDNSNVSSEATGSEEESGGEVTVAEGNNGDEATQMESAVHVVDKDKEGESSQQMEGRNDEQEGTILKSFIGEMLTGSLFSLVGLVLFSCLGNLFAGGNFQVQARVPLGSDVERLRNVQNSRPWWMRLFG